MSDDYQSEWMQYRELVLAELKRQNDEIRTSQVSNRDTVKLVLQTEKDLLKQIALLETQLEVHKSQLKMLVVFLSTVVSLAVAVGKEFIGP